MKEGTLMRKKLLFLAFAILLSLILSGCNKAEYNKLTENVAELEIEISLLDDANLEVTEQKREHLAEIDELNLENRELFQDTLRDYAQFYIKSAEYFDMVNKLHDNPELLWVNASDLKLTGKLDFEESQENFITKYFCTVYEFEDTGEKMTVEIETLDDDYITKIKFVYYYENGGETSELGYENYFNYTDLFVSAFIMLTRDDMTIDDKFHDSFERFFGKGAYFEGNAYVHNYESTDKTHVIFMILPVGLPDDVKE